MARFSLDSNILVYAADGRNPVRRASAARIVKLATMRNCSLTPQSLAEFFNSVIRKGIVPRSEAAARVRR